jgi:hypothetical protein
LSLLVIELASPNPFLNGQLSTTNNTTATICGMSLKGTCSKTNKLSVSTLME